MPSFPIVQAPENRNSPLNNNRAAPVAGQPVRAPAIRANPGMYDQVGAAGERLGNAISGVAEPVMDLRMQVKATTDAGALTQAETDMQAAHTDFQAWTKTNPDPSTWGDELDARISETKAAITERTKNLSPMAQQKLKVALGTWETSVQHQTNLQATTQSLAIAEGSFNEFINAAVTNNDLPAVEAKVKEGVEHGIYHPTQATNIVKRARLQVATNQANTMIERDPFEAERAMSEKNDEGSFKYLGNLSATARETLSFRAHKAAAETRSNTMREWASAVHDAQLGNDQMPDREAIDLEAKHQGISPKWVANLFKAPEATDPHEFATAYTAVSSYDQAADPTHEKLGELVAQVESFKGPAKEKLNTLLSAKMKPDDALNKASIKAGETAIRDMLKIGAYGKFSNQVTKITPEGTTHVTEINAGAKANAEVTAGDHMDKLHQWAKDNPEKAKSEAEVMKFVRSLNQGHATNAGSQVIQKSLFQGFGLPPAK